MPILPNLQPPSSFTIQYAVDFVRASSPEAAVIIPAAGFSSQPALTFANVVAQKILAQNMDWEWNSSYVPLFVTNCLQQDYVTNIKDIGYLTAAFAIDINNNTNTANQSPKPFYTMEVGKQLNPTAYMGQPQLVSFIQNNQANFGVWTPNTVIPCGYGIAAAPATPIQQFVDSNGNILYIDSTVLNLSINSPGFQTSNPPVLPTPNPYGTTGTTQPILPPASPAGQTILDGSVMWTVADPNACAIRLNPLPGIGGLCWLMQIVYQRKAPVYKSLQNSISPIPDDFVYLFLQGFKAMILMAAGSPSGNTEYQLWHESMQLAKESANRSQTEYGLVPSDGSFDGSGFLGFSIGAANPYQYGYGF